MRDGSNMGNHDEHAQMECSAMPPHDGRCPTWPQEMLWQGLSSQRRLSRDCVLATHRPKKIVKESVVYRQTALFL